LWVGIAGGLVLSAPRWLEWSWSGWLPLQASGALLLILSIGASAWALGTMGWPRLLLAGAMFPSGAGAEENHVPQLLVVKGPYRYVRNPIYVLDVGVLFGTALLTSNWWLVILTVAYVIQLRTQVHAEERELKARFGATYDRYCRQVPRFIPRLRPVDPAGVYRSPDLAFTLTKGAVPLRRVDMFKRTVNQRAVYERIHENSTRAHENPDRHPQVGAGG